jgi:eukaryotic-like serine/threonine-protein kinase
LIAGRYTLDREIGRGGMGAVWRGTDLTLGRAVALKRIGTAPGGGTPDVRRAEREARLAARLNHPHVVAVFDLVDEPESGDQWMVMEHVEGTNLAEIVRANGALHPDQVAPILAQVADALAAAHTAGIVHRDVKPSNILVAPDGNVKLTDFGIARTEADAALTQTGLVTGSPAYLAPEVARGQLATEASDMWSLGATLCHALTGKPPYEVADNVMGALYRIVNDDPPRPANAGWLAPLLVKSLVKDPAERWSAAQARDFLAAGPPTEADTEPGDAVVTRTTTLEAVAASEPVTQRVAQPMTQPVAQPMTQPAAAGRRRTPSALVVAAVLAVLVLTAIAFVVGLTSDDPDGTPATDPGETPSSAASEAVSASKADMEAFVSDYLALVVEDPEAAFEMLTPEFQEASDGIEGYRGWWDTVSNTKLISVEADPETMVVDYRYTYVVRGEGPETDDVSLRLEQTENGRYLIAGEA